jgi:hypothetical protein
MKVQQGMRGRESEDGVLHLPYGKIHYPVMLQDIPSSEK